jgi:hypothetical protein
MTKHCRFLFLVSCFAFLFACSDDEDVSEAVEEPAPIVQATAPTQPKIPSPRPVVAASTALPTVGATLNSQLPADTIVYLRVPNVWGILGTPKGSMYDGALGATAYVNSVAGIREGFGQNVLPELPVDIQLLVELLMVHARSPIELAVLPAATAEIPFPELLLTVALDFADAASVNEFLVAASLQPPELEVATPIDANGAGVLLLAGLPVSVHYSASDSRF